ncbi:MAG: hypothetical protein IKS20_15250 [Victivallales bacterium]|nr:hypothetical protein [Victivallales bacterium]
MSALSDKIIKASAIVTLAHLCLKFAGLIQAKVATHYLDSSTYEAIIVVAFTGVINSIFLIGEEVIGPTFLTLFMKEKEQNGEEKAWRFCNSTLTLQSLVLLAVVATIACFPDFYIKLFTTWTPEGNPTEYRLLRVSLQILAPSLYFLSIGSTTYVLLNGYRKFFLAAFGDASTKICIVIGLMLGIGIFGMDYHALLFSIVVGSVAKVVTHLLGITSKVKYLKPAFDWRSPVFKRMLLLMLPLFAGIIFAKVRDNFNNIFILTHIQQKGLLMANDLGRKLYSSIQWLVPYALQIALFPFLCELVGKNDRERLGEIVNNSCRMLIATFVPLAVILSVLSPQIAVLIFYGGKTGITVATWSGLSTACYCLVLPAAAVECVLMQGAFADQRTVAVTIIGVFSSLLSVFLSWLFIVRYNVQAEGAIATVALGFVLSRYVKSFLLGLFMRTKMPIFHIGESAVFLVRMLILAGFVALGTYFASILAAEFLPATIVLSSDMEYPHVARQWVAVRILCAGIAGVLLTLLGAFVLRVTELWQMAGWALSKLRRKKA